jgi:nucleotide-binding universal stress UspA family protein
MTIVCGTDFSLAAAPAMTAAAALASRTGDDIWLVHVLEGSIAVSKDGIRDALETAAQRGLEAEAKRIGDSSGTTVRTAVITGPAYASLPAFAEEKQARLVVVSSRGHGALPVYRLGGTSERLAQLARLPVLVVREAAAFEAWGARQRPLKVLLGFDWTASSEAALRWVKGLRERGPCDVTIGYVYYSDFADDAERRYGLKGRHIPWERDLEAERLLSRDLATAVGPMTGTGALTFRPVLGVGRTADHLLELAEAEHVDLIVVGTHHKRGLARLASVSGVALHYSRAAVASIPVPEGELLAAADAPIIRRVLVPTDLSLDSNAAALHGYALLSDRGGELVLAHATTQEERGAAEARIAELRAQLARQVSRVNVTVQLEVVSHRDAATAICELAARVGADAICMTSHGRGGLTHAILGSVADGILRQTRKPVLLVRPPRP